MFNPKLNLRFQIYIHNDREVADIITRAVTVANLHYKTVEVTATSIVSSPEISSLSLNQRKCQFVQEDSLSIRPIYTYNLCRMDCRMKLCYTLCSCIPHFYWGSSEFLDLFQCILYIAFRGLVLKFLIFTGDHKHTTIHTGKRGSSPPLRPYQDIH